jgi:cyclohexanecarboxylate-CoA ligase
MKTILTPELIAEYTKAGYWSNKTFADYADEMVERNYDRQLVVDSDNRFTFGQINEMADNLCSNLRSLGIKKGDVISIELPNWYQVLVTYLAMAKIGCIVNPIVPIYQDREVRFILKQARSKVFIIPYQFRNFDYTAMVERISPNLPHLKHVLVIGNTVPKGMLSLDKLITSPAERKFRRAKVDANSVKLLNYTSGTTAEPKGVQHTHNTLLSEMATLKAFHKMSDKDVVFMPSPVTHITGVVYALEMPFVLGCSVVLLDTWNPDAAIKLIEKERCTFMVAATPFLQHMLDTPAIKNHDVSSLRMFACGGAPVPPELVERAWKQVGWRVMRVYGSTEAPTITWGIPQDGTMEKAAHTDGKVAGYEVKIVDSEGRALPVGSEGEITAKGPELFVGYLDSKLNKDCFDADGYFHTGDLGRLDNEDYIEITGRLKDIVIRGGENISVKEIEDLLHTHPYISDVACVAMPDAKMGEKACAYVTTRAGTNLTFEEMVDFLSKQGLSKRKIPERLEMIKEFPRTPAGKIIKTELRKDVAKKLGMPPVRV